MANSARLASRRFDTISLIKILLCFYLTIAAPYSYAIDPITGAWTANAAASAAFGGGATGGAAALTAAVEAAAGAAAGAAAAAAAAAAVSGAGVAAFCAASALQGANFCCQSSNPIGSALATAGIECGGPPGATGTDLVQPTTVDPICGNAWHGRLDWSRLPDGVTCLSRNQAEEALRNTVQTKYKCYDFKLSAPYSSAEATTTGCVAIPLPGVKPADPADIGAAVGANAGARAAAAAATAAPSVTAADAAAAAATAAPRTAEAECAAKGMKHGTFNGAVFCVGTGAGVDGTGATGGQTGTDAGAGTGTGTGNPPATGTSTPPFVLPAFCTWAETVCSWFLWTKEEPAAANPAQNKVDIKDRQTSDIPGLPTNIDTTRISWGQNCPAPISSDISLMGQSINLAYKFDVVCDFAANLRPYIIGLSYLTGAYIVMGLNRSRSD